MNNKGYCKKIKSERSKSRIIDQGEEELAGESDQQWEATEVSNDQAWDKTLYLIRKITENKAALSVLDQHSIHLETQD